MKKMILVFATIITAAIFVASCKKSDPAPTTTQKIQKNWIFEKNYYHEVSTGFPEYRDTTIGVAGDYADFRTDNKLYSHFGGYSDTVNYSVIDDSKLIIDGDTATILVLNDTQFHLNGRSGTSTDFYEYTVYLKK